MRLARDERVSAVHVAARNGSERTIDESAFSYDRAAQSLGFKPNVLSVSDSEVRVEITADCMPFLL